MMVRIRNVGTNHGDCFFIEIENDLCKNIIMVDGRKGDKNSLDEIEKIVLEYGNIDYLIVTHIDNDHINGILKMLTLPKENPIKQAFKNTIVLYNYVTKPVISYTQARDFEKLIQDNTVVSTVKKYYCKFSSPCLKILSATQRKKLDPREQMKVKNYVVLTILHPNKEGVEKVYKDYLAHCDKSTAKLVNRNSIVFLLEYGEHAALFTGDCYMKDIIVEIEQLKNMKNSKIDLIKIPHHGAKDNNEGLAKFAKDHETQEFILTAGSVQPVKELLQQLDDAADSTEELRIYSHMDLSNLDGLKHIKIDQNDVIEWRAQNDQ